MLIYVHNLIVFSLTRVERMGGVLSWVQQYFEEEKFVVVLGLDGAGKTALVHRLRFGEANEPLPTMGFLIHPVLLHNRNLQIADTCGQDKVRDLWGCMYHSADGIVFVLDGTDRERLPLALEELNRVQAYPMLEDKPFLILVNKQDENAVGSEELKGEVREGMWRMFDVSVKTGHGIDEAFTWLDANLR